jgi:secreted trypsin-like serine protease
MMRIVTNLVFLIIISSNTKAQEDALEGRIIGGTDVPFGTYPWFAKARKGSDWGGTLVDTVVVIPTVVFS